MYNENTGINPAITTFSATELVLLSDTVGMDSVVNYTIVSFCLNLGTKNN
jgi:hypothetical protein